MRAPWRPIAILVTVATLLTSAFAYGQVAVLIVIETTLGSIDVELDSAHAPITTSNFLRYVDAKMYDGGRFHRAVRLDNQVRKDLLIQVIQGSRDPERVKTVPDRAPLGLERTSSTTLKHVDGTISMARGNTADSAVSDFFLCIGAQPSLDFGGGRAADGQGFAAFGRVVKGMEVVRAIQASPTNDREEILEPVVIVRVYRK